MKVLVADDSVVSRTLVSKVFARLNHEILVVENGDAAVAAFGDAAPPHLAILDWEMPGHTGPEICAEVRRREWAIAPYLILLTSRETKGDLVHGLEAGADDYLTKPFDGDELLARIRVGERMLDLQIRLAERVRQLEDALSKVQTLEGLLPICSYCKKVRDDGNYWHQVEAYVEARSHAQFSHGICPDCYEKHVKPQLEQL